MVLRIFLRIVSNKKITCDQYCFGLVIAFFEGGGGEGGLMVHVSCQKYGEG